VANREFWLKKFDRNVQRDQQVVNLLERLGWRVEVIWECQTQEDILHPRLRLIFGIHSEEETVSPH
jgi:DNA mismatch endonuclease (patch repair protein)